MSPFTSPVTLPVKLPVTLPVTLPATPPEAVNRPPTVKSCPTTTVGVFRVMFDVFRVIVDVAPNVPNLIVGKPDAEKTASFTENLPFKKLANPPLNEPVNLFVASVKFTGVPCNKPAKVSDT